MTPAEQSKLAALAGIESGECFPGDTPWRRLYTELIEDAKRREMCAENQRLLNDALQAEKWRGIACAKGGDGRTVQMIEAETREACAKEVAAMREALSYYAESSNWRRDVHTVGLRKAWKKPAVASDRGGLARLTLMNLEGTK